MAENTLDVLKQNLIEYVRLQLGDRIVDVELDAEHFEAAYQRTIGVYRQRAQNAYEESYSFLELVADVDTYTLPQEVINVRQVFRRTFGNSQGSQASNFDPFTQAIAFGDTNVSFFGLGNIFTDGVSTLYYTGNTYQINAEPITGYIFSTLTKEVGGGAGIENYAQELLLQNLANNTNSGFFNAIDAGGVTHSTSIYVGDANTLQTISSAKATNTEAALTFGTDFFEITTDGQLQASAYPNTRDDSATTPENFLYTDVDGNVLSAPLSYAKPYKVYTALLTQSGTNPPTATVLENTLGGTVVWSYTSPGYYVATLNNTFTINKTAIIFSFADDGNGWIATPYYIDDSNIGLSTMSDAVTPANGKMLYPSTIEIRVYN